MPDYYSVRWLDGKVSMLDQRMLPQETIYRDFARSEDVAGAIQQMVIRGAPAIGIAAGFGLALTALHGKAKNREALVEQLNHSAETLRMSRPTAVNLFGAIERILQVIENSPEQDVESLRSMVVMEAQKIADEDVEMNKKMALHAQRFIPRVANIIHHCNTGGLATGGYGTALGAIRAAHESGKKVHVYVDETRPRLQGARLTSWELKQLGIPHTIIVDGASGFVMSHTQIDACLVGCDRIAANGDVANKIGTYNLALVAAAHKVPFYSIGPRTTIDLTVATGDQIPIEERDGSEVTHIGDISISPEGVEVANPAFDITPAKYITAIITDAGVASPPYRRSLAKLMSV